MIVESLKQKTASLAVIGLGYVGLPIALAFSKHLKVIGFDIKRERIERLRKGCDDNGEFVEKDFENRDISFSFIEEDLTNASCFIIAVPTPIDKEKKPDLTLLLEACRLVGKYVRKHTIVCFESTVYPGCTDEECIPILEEISGLTCGVDFEVGYSPERINPGDKQHTLQNTMKIISGFDQSSLKHLRSLYELILSDNIFPVSSIKVAEASKIMENTQRDINIALMNEFSKIFHLMGIDTQEVIQAAATKWNFHPYIPGLVGGHCIGVDPYYLIQSSIQKGYVPRLILEACLLNDAMGDYLVERLNELASLKGISLKDAKILILGITFKENCPDIRNTKVMDVYKALGNYTEQITIVDPLADFDEVLKEYGVSILKEIKEDEQYDIIVKAVSHDCFIDLGDMSSYFKEREKGIFFDVKGSLDKSKSDGRL